MHLTIPYLDHLKRLAGARNLPVHLVGGVVRDLFLKRPNADFDFAVPSQGLELARDLAEVIAGVFIPLDRERGCGRVAKKVNGRLVTLDIADYRAPGIEGDLAHRDFTINAMAVDIQQMKDDVVDEADVIDLHGGKKDLVDGVIRMVAPAAFAEDPLRTLRAFSLQAVLQLRVEPATLQQIAETRSLLRAVAYERITTELFKILESPRAADTLTQMDEAGLLEQVIPQLRVMAGCKQGGYHHLDVWPHSLEVVRQMEMIINTYQDHADVGPYLRETLSGDRTRQALMKLGALLHDIGKPDTRKKEGERLSFHGHERVGRDITHHVALLLKFSTMERHVLEDMVMLHLRPGYLSNYEQPSDRMIFRFLRDAGEEAANILLLSLADQRSTRGPLTSERDQAHHERICLELLDLFFAKKKEEPFIPLISGEDLIRDLGLKPSPLFKIILRDIEEQQALGQVSSREDALQLARQIADKEQRPCH